MTTTLPRSPQAQRHAKSRKAVTRSADDITRLLQTGSTKRSPTEKAIAIFSYPGLKTLTDCYVDYRVTAMDGRGRKPAFPPGVLIGTAVLARAIGSLPEALGLLHDEDVWARVRRAWESFDGAAPLPPHPPSRGHVQEVRKTIETREGLLAAFKETFTGMSVRQARLLGHLLPSEDADLTRVDPLHTVFGDGVILKPMTDVMEVLNPITGAAEYIGSRASLRPPRVQKEVRTLEADHPGQQGINFVAMHTETSAGLVTLGIEATLQAEQWATLEVLHRIVAHAANAVHTVVYDGALSGWVLDHLMGGLGIDVVQKGRKRPTAAPGSRQSTGDEMPEADAGERKQVAEVAVFDVDAAVDAQVADFLDTLHGPEPAPGKRGKRLDAASMVVARRMLRHDELNRLWQSGAPLPVGTSLYPSARDEAKFELVNSAYEFLTVVHSGDDGSQCDHTLVVDDGALFTVGVDDTTGTLVKARQLHCRTARREHTPTGYVLQRSFTVPCELGDFTWTYAWSPDPTRYAPGAGRPANAPYDSLGRALRTIPRARHKRFKRAQRLRNYAESFNNWFELLLPRFGRATSMTLAGQELDFLLAAVAMNAFTWENHSRQGQV